jgi:Zn-dependent protease
VQLARVFGIRVGASPTWFLFLFLMIWWLSSLFRDALPDSSDTVTYAVAVAGALLFFVSIALHELGHAVVARRNGIDVLGIDLWVFGGLARLSRDSASPGEEFRVAAAGPAVTALLLALGLVGVAATSHSDATLDLFDEGGVSTPLLGLLAWLTLVNAGLLLFNLIPGFPLDGGRIARAIAWKVTGDRHRATRLAGRLGQGVAYVLIGLGLWLALGTSDAVNGIWLMIVGWFLSQGARGAVVASAFSERIEGVTAADLMDDHPVAVPDATTALSAQDEFFLRYGLPWFPVVDGAGRLQGLLRVDRVTAAMASGQPALNVLELLDADADRDVRVARDASLESLLQSEPLRRLGALAVVDADGRLCGLVTLDRIRRALAASG